MSGSFKYRVKYESSRGIISFDPGAANAAGYPNIYHAVHLVNDKIEELNEIGYDQVTLTSTYLRKAIISQYYHDPTNGHDMVEVEEHLYVVDMINLIQLIPDNATNVFSVDV